MSTEFVRRSVLCTEGNESRVISGGSSTLEMERSVQEEPKAEHHLHVERARDSLRSYSFVVLGPCVGYPLRRDTNED
jgi:hypothetical protein